MKSIKRILVLFVAFMMLLPCCVACIGTGSQTTETPTPKAEVQADTPKPTEAPTATPEPTEPPTEAPTEEPTPEPLKQGDLDAEFMALDEELFKWYVTTDITTLDQFCRHPEDFGIDESTVPVTLGSIMEDDEDSEFDEQFKQYRERLLAIDRNGLSDQLQFAYDTYLKYFDEGLESDPFEYNYEPLDIGVGIHQNLPLVFGLYNFYDEQDVKNYMTLLEDVPRFMGEILAYEQERANLGLFMTEDALEEILDDLNAVAKSGNTSFLHGTFKSAMEKVDFLTEEQKQEYIKQNDKLVKTVWVEGYKLLYDGLKKLKPQCREAVGAYEQGGTAYDYFCWKLKHDGSSDRTVEDAIAFLDGVIEEVYNEMYDSAMRSIDKWQEGRVITTGSIGGDEAYLKTLIKKIVPPMPEVEVDYVEVPKELQESFSPAAYMRPAFDDYQHNVILTNPKNQANYDMSTLAHEGYPGHMYQFTYQYSLGTIPKFQMLIETKGYAESWSTNSELNIARINERFGEDYAISYFLDDQFTTILLMYCSLMINGQGASKNVVRKYLSRWNMGQYVDRIYELCIEMPIYYIKYAMGFAELYDLTQRCKEKLGDKFDSIEFYKEYLHWGPGKFEDLRERMYAWCDAQ